MEEAALEVPVEAASAEVLHEHLELSHYVETYRHSTERVRYIIFILMTLSVLVLVAQWNTADRSWLRHRFDKLRAVSREAKGLDEPSADAIVKKRMDDLYQRREELDKMLEEYRQAVVERVYLVEIPGLGVTFDVNDLALFSGVAFSLLMLLLVFALMREYENLYLALFKVRRLNDSRSNKRGNETANYLYHTLAMSQVFSAPPTLAIWKPSWVKRAVPIIIFFLPAAVMTYIIYVNQRTLTVARAYGVPPSVMVPQYALLGVVILFAIIAAAYSLGCNYRWDSAFKHINPGFQHIRALPWTVWLRLPIRARSLGDHLQRRISAQLVQRLKLDKHRPNACVTIRHSIDVEGDDIAYAEVQTMCVLLRKEAQDLAEENWDTAEILRADIASSVLHEQKWYVKAHFEYRGEKRSDASDDAGE
jgi:hypothetical protein